eukprot:TRINITY_DN7440_c0_g1_i1.p1 TRINITY_DN7440_c0_g1~~TRINITY_DN7440_c0_g1_i1.p1  ORF type:complete len:251 (-),score=52.59 TRINITY_DN7440_c0_g1_i1:48-755(-)
MDSTLPGGSSVENTPGDAKSLKRTLMELGSEVIQTFHPFKQFKTHFCGFAFYCGDPNRQVELHHYCAAINDEVFQCCVYDSPDPDARLIGIEYVVSEKIFNTLDPEEQKYWHNHAYDVKSGSFIAPGLPSPVEKKLMSELMTTYGKTFILWQTDRGDKLPLGPPQLMMTANKDGMWHEELFKAREERRGSFYNVETIRENRKDMVMPPMHPNCDHWDHGHKPLQCTMTPIEPKKQ